MDTKTGSRSHAQNPAPTSCTRHQMLVPGLAQPLTAPTDPATTLKHKPIHITDTMVIANIDLQWEMLESRYGEQLARSV